MLKKRVIKFMVHLRESVLRYTAILRFCKKNQKYWNKGHPGEQYVYIAYPFHGMSEFLYQILLFAKGMDSVSNYKINILTSKTDMLLKKLCKSFEVDYILMDNFSIKYYFSLFLETCKMQKAVSSGKDLLEYEYNNILIGPSIYDTILVKTGRGTYEGEKNIKIFGIFFKNILLTEQLIRLFSQNPPVSCIVMEEAFESEIYRRVAKFYEVPIVWVNKWLKKYIDQNGEITTFMADVDKREIGEKLDTIRKKTIYNDQVEKSLLRYYHNNDTLGMKGVVVSGKAVKDKVTKSKEEIIKELYLDSDKKNVFVFSHCMTDGPHSCPQLLYQDYFVWLKRTLEIARDVKSVNWIVKFHPDRFMRFGHEQIETERIIEEFKTADNIYFFPDNYSLLSAKALADIVVTARGTVGEEMSCFGIPVITAGRPCYSVWGYTYSFNEVKDYERFLLEIDKIDRLEAEKIDMAKRVFYAHSLPTYDILDDDIGQKIDNMVKERRKGNLSNRVIDIDFLRKMSSDDVLGMMKQSKLYKAGVSYALEIK